MTKIILFGDSITAGYENGVTDFRLNEGIEKEFPEIEVINAGIPGDTTKGAVLRVEDHVMKYDPDLVVIFFGANDAVTHNDVSIEEYELNLKQLIRKIGSDKIILIGGPFARQEARYALDRPIDVLREYSETVEKVASYYQVPFVNLLNQMQELNPETLLQEDGLHFSKQGYELLIQLINQEIKDKKEG